MARLGSSDTSSPRHKLAELSSNIAPKQNTTNSKRRDNRYTSSVYSRNSESAKSSITSRQGLDYTSCVVSSWSDDNSVSPTKSRHVRDSTHTSYLSAKSRRVRDSDQTPTLSSKSGQERDNDHAPTSSAKSRQKRDSDYTPTSSSKSRQERDNDHPSPSSSMSGQESDNDHSPSSPAKSRRERDGDNNHTSSAKSRPVRDSDNKPTSFGKSRQESDNVSKKSEDRDSEYYCETRHEKDRNALRIRHDYDIMDYATKNLELTKTNARHVAKIAALQKEVDELKMRNLELEKSMNSPRRAIVTSIKQIHARHKQARLEKQMSEAQPLSPVAEDFEERYTPRPSPPTVMSRIIEALTPPQRSPSPKPTGSIKRNPVEFPAPEPRFLRAKLFNYAEPSLKTKMRRQF